MPGFMHTCNLLQFWHYRLILGAALIVCDAHVIRPRLEQLQKQAVHDPWFDLNLYVQSLWLLPCGYDPRTYDGMNYLQTGYSTHLLAACCETEGQKPIRAYFHQNRAVNSVSGQWVFLQSSISLKCASLRISFCYPLKIVAVSVQSSTLCRLVHDGTAPCFTVGLAWRHNAVSHSSQLKITALHKWWPAECVALYKRFQPKVSK